MNKKILNFFLFPFCLDPQAERYVDRKLDQAEYVLKKNQKNAKKWYTALIGDEEGVKINNFHVFVAAFAGGVFLGLASV